MYVNLIQNIKTILETITAIKEVHAYPLREGEKISKYPAVVFFPDSATNEFETVRDNKKDYRFKLYVIVDASQKSLDDIFTDILPNAVDQVIAEFDENWSTNITGSLRSTLLIDSGSWTITQTDKAVEAVAELNLRARLLTPVS